MFIRQSIAISLFFLSIFLSNSVLAEEKNGTSVPASALAVAPRVTIFGLYDKRADIPGSAHIVSKESLQRSQYRDVHRALREVPGVVLQEEDGHGLRPNIGIRGGRSNRSADITLMEDGVLMAPAPYAAPEAYYFPQMERMQSLEVVKGVGAIKFGPRTTNGVLNMVTKDIPSKPTADVSAQAGTHSTLKTGVTTGNRWENVGFVVSAFHKETEGFKEIDSVGGDTGYDVQDVMAKLRVNTSPGRDTYQHIDLKLGVYDEHSDETYLGLTDADFRNNPYRRYAASQLDRMDVNAMQMAATHYIAFSPKLDVTTTLYRNAVDRAWYRLGSVSGTDIGAVFNDQITNAARLATLQSSDTAGGAFRIRDNNRSYLAYGVQSVLGFGFDTGAVKHDSTVGVRYHTDEEDRFQREDSFDLVGGRAVITAMGAPGSNANRIQAADALGAFIEHEINWGRLTVTPGVRFEHITLSREDFGTADPNRTGAARTFFENTLDVVIPGVGVKVNVAEGLDVLGGVHKGFAPPGVPANAGEAAFSREEKSMNYELGARYADLTWQGEVFGFFTDYENLLGRDTSAAGGGGTGATFNGGKVQVYGLEASLGYDAGTLVSLPATWRLPLKVGYTHLQSEFLNSFVSTFSEWGTVSKGDSLPYVPEHQIFLSAGLEGANWGFTTTAKYVESMRTRAGKGEPPAHLRTDAHWVFDMAGDYRINDRVKLFATLENVFDNEYIAARRPAGVRPGMPLTGLMGITVSLGE